MWCDVIVIDRYWCEFYIQAATEDRISPPVFRHNIVFEAAREVSTASRHTDEALQAEVYNSPRFDKGECGIYSEVRFSWKIAIFVS